jgi:multicomponent Na+:H+ antiporter subunit G
MIEIFSVGCLACGTFFVFTGCLGVLRFEDVYLRLQASSKSITFGFGFVMLGAGLLAEDWDLFAKAMLAVAFQFLTAPVAAQTIARAAMMRGHKPVKLEEDAPPS